MGKRGFGGGWEAGPTFTAGRPARRVQDELPGEEGGKLRATGGLSGWRAAVCPPAAGLLKKLSACRGDREGIGRRLGMSAHLPADSEPILSRGEPATATIVQLLRLPPHHVDVPRNHGPGQLALPFPCPRRCLSCTDLSARAPARRSCPPHNWRVAQRAACAAAAANRRLSWGAVTAALRR